MKILLVTHRYPPRTGGVETHVREVATRLVTRGHDVTVFSADAGSDVSSNAFDDGVHVRRFRSMAPGESFYLAPQLAVAVRRTDADVVHAHNYHAFPLLCTAFGVSGRRFVVTTHYHGESAKAYRDRLLSLYRPLGKWAIRRADEVVAVSEWERDRLRETFEVDATVIPNGLAVDRFANADPEVRERPYILCVGRLEAYKGIQHVIEALQELPEYDLLVAGSGPYQGELERISREQRVADRVEFLGYVADQRLPGLYAGADVYITLSEFEAYGMTVAEALAAGTPCVVSMATALQEWSDVEGVVGNRDPSPETVAQSVRQAASQNATNRPPTWSETVDKLIDIYTGTDHPDVADIGRSKRP